MFLRPRMTRYGGHAGPYVWGGVTGVTDRDNPWLTAVQANTATRLVVSANSYDAEQRFLVNENPLSVRTALGVGFGTAGCAGPIFAPDMYGPAMWLDQTLAAAYVSCTVPTLTSSTAATIQVEVAAPDMTPASDTYLFRTNTGGPYLVLQPSGKIQVYDGTSWHVSASTVSALIGVSDGERWSARVVMNGTSWAIDVRVPGGLWTSAVSATGASTTLGGKTLYTGSSSTSAGFRGKLSGLTIRDGGVSDPIVAEFTPGLFVGGNRANGDTAVDAYGVTWTITRPAAGSDIPTVNTAGGVTYLTSDGVNDFGKVVGDDTITDFVPGTGLTLILDASVTSSVGTFARLVSNANSSNDGVSIIRHDANQRVYATLDDGTTVATLYAGVDNITYGSRLMAVLACGSSDHETYVDGVSDDTDTSAVSAIAAPNPLTVFSRGDGAQKAAYDFYGLAVIGERVSDANAAVYASEGLAI